MYDVFDFCAPCDQHGKIISREELEQILSKEKTEEVQVTIQETKTILVH